LKVHSSKFVVRSSKFIVRSLLQPSGMNLISQLSPHLFWDVNPGELETDRSKKLIIKRVLEYGLWEDWLLLKKFYGLETITNITRDFRELDARSLAFIAHLSGFLKKNSNVILPNSRQFNTGTSKKTSID
jgi:hypothetical protein